MTSEQINKAKKLRDDVVYTDGKPMAGIPSLA